MSGYNVSMNTKEFITSDDVTERMFPLTQAILVPTTASSQRALFENASTALTSDVITNYAHDALLLSTKTASTVVVDHSTETAMSSGAALSVLQVFVVCVLVIVVVSSVFGNVLVCVAIFTERSLRKSSNYFYVSLAIADLLVAAVVMTFALANDVMGYWMFGSVFCDIWLSSDVNCSGGTQYRDRHVIGSSVECATSVRSLCSRRRRRQFRVWQRAGVCRNLH